MRFFLAKGPVGDRRMEPRTAPLKDLRVGWLDPEAALAGWWTDFSVEGAKISIFSGKIIEPGSLLRGWAQDPRPGAAREFLAIDARVVWSLATKGAPTLAGCRFERVARPEALALRELVAGLSTPSRAKRSWSR